MHTHTEQCQMAGIILPLTRLSQSEEMSYWVWRQLSDCTLNRAGRRLVWGRSLGVCRQPQNEACPLRFGAEIIRDVGVCPCTPTNLYSEDAKPADTEGHCTCVQTQHIHVKTLQREVCHNYPSDKSVSLSGLPLLLTRIRQPIGLWWRYR